jgi:hypothetical protein
MGGFNKTAHQYDTADQKDPLHERLLLPAKGISIF